jgi:hypothetical protein
MDPRVLLASGPRMRASGRLEMPKAAGVCVDKWMALPALGLFAVAAIAGLLRP